MKSHTFPLAALAAVLLASCGPSEAELKAQREKQIADSLAALASMERPVLLDIAASQVRWEGTMLGVKRHYGTVNLTEGKLTVKGPTVVGGSFAADLNTIMATDEGEYKYEPEGAKKGTKSMLIGHLKSADFFDVANHPAATFEITRVEGNTAYGNLTVRGVTNEEKVTDITVTEADGGVKVTGKLAFDRQKYGVSWSTGAKDMVLGDEIKLDVTLAGKYQ